MADRLNLVDEHGVVHLSSSISFNNTPYIRPACVVYARIVDSTRAPVTCLACVTCAFVVHWTMGVDLAGETA